MGASTQSSEGLVTGINVTPFVDVVLVLLVALMVTASDLAAQAIGVDLPRATTGTDAPPRALAVTVDASGAVRVDGAPVDDEGLRVAVHAARARDADVRAVVAADGAATHAKVVHVVDVLRREQIARFALEVARGE